MMGTPASLWKCPAYLPLIAEVCQPNTNIGVSFCFAFYAPPSSSQVSSTVYDDSPHWCILVTTYMLSNFPDAGDVWFSLNGTTYQNNSCVALEDIGKGNDNALLCVTNLTVCCRKRDSSTPLVNWFFPNGTRVGDENIGWGFYRVRGHMVVRMHRRRGGMAGIYRCEIPDSTNVIQTIYIGVYTAGTGE